MSIINQVKEGPKLFDKYQIQSQNLSKHTAIHSFKVINLQTGQNELLKIDYECTETLLQEFRILTILQPLNNFPKVFEGYFGSNPYFLTEEYFPSDLSLLIKEYRKFDLATTVSVYLQIIRSLEMVHKQNLVHGNICPNSVVLNESQSQIMLRQFSNSFFTDSGRDAKKSELSCAFASLNVNCGKPCWKDDLESLGYLIIYMLTGDLPWKGRYPKGTFSKWQKIYIIKRSYTDKELCSKCPNEFEEYLTYVKGLKFQQDTNYNYMRILMLKTIPISKLNSFIWEIECSPNKRTKNIKEFSMVFNKKLRHKTTIARNHNKSLIEKDDESSNVTNIQDFPEFKNRQKIIKARDSFIKKTIKYKNDPEKQCSVI